MMENSGAGRKVLLQPAKFQQSTKPEETNGKSSENGNTASFISNNPFLKCHKEDVEPVKSDVKHEESEKSDSSPKDLFKPAKSNLFVQSSALSENSTFVFGQNLHERAVIDKVNSNEKSDENEKSEEEKPPSSDLFSAALTKSKSPEKESSNDSTQESNEDKTESLVEAAKKYQNQKYEEMKSAQKRKFEEVQTTTGEEDEKNILEVNCKLFAYIDNNYEERGRGTLRLNDSKDNSYSRVVFRTSGIYKVFLNTKVFRNQICETPSQKSLRLTAVDSNGVAKIFLVMGRVEDISQLNHLLSIRIQRAKDLPVDDNEKVVETPEIDSQQSDDVEPETKRTAIASE